MKNKKKRRNMSENESNNFPEYLILSDKIYKLNVSEPIYGGRAFNRGLVDFRVEGINPLDSRDQWLTLLGMSEELYEDYPSYRLPVPFGWVLFRFLCHHVRANYIDILKGPGGEVLTTMNYQNYIGGKTDDFQAEDILRTILSSWVRTLPHEKVKMRDLYVSTDLFLDTLKRATNSLIFQNHIEKSDENSFFVKPIIFREVHNVANNISLDRKSNRYYQEIFIQADEPFCFIIMPFRNNEFDQSIYFDVVKPLIEDEFEILCYRVDEDFLPDRIDNKIYTYLLRASFIIAEVTTQNPNVLYELGIAHMLEKDCIILTQKPNLEVPFDINRISAKPYETVEQLRTYLRKAISALAFRTKR
jgi:hypothetical protein